MGHQLERAYMKSPVAWNNAGNHNLKGKKYKLLSCGCCEVQDYRDWERDKRHTKEIQNAKRGIYDV